MVRGGTGQQALLILFAYATDTADPRPELLSYADTLLGGMKHRAKQMPVRKKYLNFVIRRINELTAKYLAG